MGLPPVHEPTTRVGRRPGLLLGLLFGALLTVAPLPIRAADVSASADDPRPCPDLPIFLKGGNPTERATVCRGGADALAFFEANGFRPPDRIDVEIGTPLPPGVRESAAGCYEPSTKRVLLVTYERLRRFRTWFDQPVQPATYHALATHEIAHAIAACLFRDPRPSHRAHEFVAYAATLEKMDPALRERILAAYPDDDAGDRRLSDLVHALNPTRFAVDAWLFWRRPENGAAFLRQVLAGEVLLGDGGY